jgi:hypothetical protein
MRKAKLCRVFKQYSDKDRAWVWMREYYIDGLGKRVIKSPHQQNQGLMKL